MGKLSTRNLVKLLECIKKDPRVIVPPLPGYDSGVHLIGDRYLVISTDPCIGVPEKWFGWFLIHYASSDVALFGAKPEFCTISLLGPLSTNPETFRKVMEKACEAANDLGTAIVTGHTGTYGGMAVLVGVCTAYGTVNKEKLITPGGAQPGDLILCIKPICLETVVNFALTQRALAEKLFGAQRTRELSGLVRLQSCVREALLLAEAGGINAMHDATEGGFTAALNELAEASGVGFEIDFSEVPIPNEVHILQEFFELSEEQIFAMSSTGTVIAAVRPEANERIRDLLRRKGVEVRYLGTFTKDKRRILRRNGEKTVFPEKADDPYARILSGS